MKKTIKVIFLIILSLPLLSEENQYLEKTEKLLNEKKEDDRIIKRLKEIKTKMENGKFNEEVNKYREKISKMLDLPELKKTENPVELNATPLLFISSSMPIRVLRAYALQLEKYKGIMILRGNIGQPNKIKPTISFVNSLLKKQIACTSNCKILTTQVSIDPRLFKKYQIEKVPALIVADKIDQEHYFNSMEKNIPEGSEHIIYGDASINGMINAHYEATNSFLSQSLIN